MRSFFSKEKAYVNKWITRFYLGNLFNRFLVPISVVVGSFRCCAATLWNFLRRLIEYNFSKKDYIFSIENSMRTSKIFLHTRRVFIFKISVHRLFNILPNVHCHIPFERHIDTILRLPTS